MIELFQLKHESGHMTDNYLDQKAAIVALIPGMKEYHNDLKSTLKEMDLQSQVTTTNLKGVTIEKDKKKEILINTIYSLSTKITSFAHIQGMDKLENEINFPKSELKRCSNEEFLSRAGIILSRAKEFLPDLVKFNITNDDLSAIETQINEYKVVSVQPKLTLKQRREDNFKLKELVMKLDRILKGLDITARTAIDTNPEFYREYKLVRKLNNKRTGKFSVLAKIKDATTGLPVKNVKIRLAGGEEVSQEFLAAYAGFRLKGLAPGEYTLSAAIPGYREKNQKLVIIPNETSKVELLLEKE